MGLIFLRITLGMGMGLVLGAGMGGNRFHSTRIYSVTTS